MHTPVRVLVGSLGAGMLADAAQPPPAGTVLLDLGPEHPSNAGLIELDLWVADDIVTQVRIGVGSMHRGAEKLFEVRDYRQILMLADRHDWQAPFAGELGVALAVEELLGLEVPSRAVWLRTLLAEHTRILSHAGFAAYVPHRLGRPHRLHPLREALREQTLRLTGNRIHPMANRIGGVAVDPDAVWLTAQEQLMASVGSAATELLRLADSDEFGAVAGGLAPLSREVIRQYGVTGPAARATGIDLDLRRHRPYLAYGALADLLPASNPEGGESLSATSGVGDARSRLRLLGAEMRVSADLVTACCAELRRCPGPVAVKLNKILKLPEGEVYSATEAPLGVAGVFLVSRGEKTPWRLKLRTPSFNHVSALESLLIGVPAAAIETVLASVGYVVGDIDR